MSIVRFPMIFMALAGLLLAWPSAAQDAEPPYWVSLKVDRANMRVGPDRSYPIDWVYVRRDLPLRVVRKSGGWRLVEDQDGARGWMLARFLSRDRTATVTVEGQDLDVFTFQLMGSPEASTATCGLWKFYATPRDP